MVDEKTEAAPALKHIFSAERIRHIADEMWIGVKAGPHH